MHNVGLQLMARRHSAYGSSIIPKVGMFQSQGGNILVPGWELEVKQLLDEVTAEAKKSGDKEIYRFDISPISGDEFYGNDWHPNVYQDEKMATELTAYLRSLMNWF